MNTSELHTYCLTNKLSLGSISNYRRTVYDRLGDVVGHVQYDDRGRLVIDWIE